MAVILAAYRRGWNTVQIGSAALVSHQAISERIRSYEKQHGPITQRERHVSKTAKYPWRCAQCQKLEWSSRIRLQHSERHYCSMSCYAAQRRGLTDDQVKAAIALRLEGESWKYIAKIIGYPTQTIQLRVWKHLFLTCQLNRGMVESIWVGDHYSSPTNIPAPSWAWIEARTGIVCTEHGVEYRPISRNRRPWGERLLSNRTVREG